MYKVLVVDDSAFMRKAVSTMIESDPEIKVVAMARDGEEGIDLLKKHKPDVVTLDVEMPRMDGLEALGIIMRHMPTPVLMVSSLTEEGAGVTLQALELGAVDYIPKNLTGSTLAVMKIKEELICKIKSVAGKRLARVSSPISAKAKPVTPLAAPKNVMPSAARRSIMKVAVVGIGVSTGGPKALQSVLPQFPADFPAAIFVVQHMPAAFTGAFAQRMDDICPMKVREAKDNQVVNSGEILIAPGGKHMKVVRKQPTEISIELTSKPTELLYKPSADVMLNSMADIYPGRSIGVIMTGMGADGLEGMTAIREKKGRTIAQNEETCVVYGMPKAVVDAGVADKIVPLQFIAGEVMNMI